MWHHRLRVSKWSQGRALTMFGPQAIGAGVVTRTPGCAGTGSESDRATVGSPTSGCKPDRTGTTLPDIGTAEPQLNTNSSDPGSNPAMQSVLGWLRAWLPPGCGWAAGPHARRSNSSNYASPLN